MVDRLVSDVRHVVGLRDRREFEIAARDRGWTIEYEATEVTEVCASKRVLIDGALMDACLTGTACGPEVEVKEAYATFGQPTPDRPFVAMRCYFGRPIVKTQITECTDPDHGLELVVFEGTAWELSSFELPHAVGALDTFFDLASGLAGL